MQQCQLYLSPQLKAQMMLLEAQLEKQSDQRDALEELEQVHHRSKKSKPQLKQALCHHSVKITLLVKLTARMHKHHYCSQ